MLCNRYENNINLCTIKNLHEYRIILFILRILIYKCVYAFIHAKDNFWKDIHKTISSDYL